MTRHRHPTSLAAARRPLGRTLAALAAPLVLAAAPQAQADDSQGYWDENPVEIGVRAGYMQLEDADNGQTLPTGGLGAYLRFRLGRRLGLEMAMDAYISDQLARETPGEVVSVTLPITGSALFYLFPESDFSLYLLGGLGVAANAVTYEALGQQAAWASPVVQLGIGTQLRIDDTSLDLSLRTLMMHRSEGAVEVSPLEGQDYVLRHVDYAPRTDARSVTGAMLTLGIHFTL